MIIVSFSKQGSSKTEVFKNHMVWSLMGVVVLLWRKRGEAQEQTAWSEDPLVAWEK